MDEPTLPDSIYESFSIRLYSINRYSQFSRLEPSKDLVFLKATEKTFLMFGRRIGFSNLKEILENAPKPPYDENQFHNYRAILKRTISFLSQDLNENDKNTILTFYDYADNFHVANILDKLFEH
jgi:hypothetical protein